MKKLILAFILSFSFVALAETCPEGDKNCTSTTSGGAGTIAVGIDCEACRAMEKAQGALLSNSVGVFRGGSQGTDSGTNTDTTATPAGVKK